MPHCRRVQSRKQIPRRNGAAAGQPAPETSFPCLFCMNFHFFFLNYPYPLYTVSYSQRSLLYYNHLQNPIKSCILFPYLRTRNNVPAGLSLFVFSALVRFYRWRRGKQRKLLMPREASLKTGQCIACKILSGDGDEYGADISACQTHV